MLSTLRCNEKYNPIRWSVLAHGVAKEPERCLGPRSIYLHGGENGNDVDRRASHTGLVGAQVHYSGVRRDLVPSFYRRAKVNLLDHGW